MKKLNKKIKWIELNVQPEHIQGTASIPMDKSPFWALHKLKRISANLFFKHYPYARKRYPKGHLWSRGKFAASVGFVQIEILILKKLANFIIVNEYVRNQDEHHGTVWDVQA